ncbi:cytochrome P450 315a1, mitochondrial-like [Ctenocephalides felis]|uniref:cytochrome P450 315a1, mitochondrial-like n=1 Tax=Ctenocephalides felis TaxID=7515 RepID=UPI000E6E1F36|nr:cytochrome P450 315a1, mitochondrial-like [Ctenocephalides felis]
MALKVRNALRKMHLIRTAIMLNFGRGRITRWPKGYSQPKGLALLGTLPQLLAMRLHEYIDNRHRSLGPVFREAVGPVRAVFLCDPDDMRAVFSPRAEGRRPRHVLPDSWLLHNRRSGAERGLLFMDGEEWWHFRRLMNKLLMGKDLNWLGAPLDICLDKLITDWGKDLQTGESKNIVDLEQNLYRLSIDVMVAALLGSAYEPSRHILEPTLEKFGRIVHEVFLHSAKLTVIPAEIAEKFQLPAWRRFVRAVDTTLSLGNMLVNQILDECPEGDGLMAGMINEGVSRSDIQRIVTDLVIAAGDTTAFTTQWALLLLAKNSHQQNKVRNDILNGNRGLTKGVLRETLRLYPVATFITRFLAQDMLLGGYSIPEGTLTICSLYTAGRDPENFARPQEFLPERWCRNDALAGEGLLRAHASIPFALGSRSCIGQRIANMQIQETLAKLLESFTIECTNTNKIEMVMRMVAVPSEPVKLKITKL